MCSLGQSENHERTPRVPAQLPRRRPSGSTPKASQRNHTSKLGTFSLRRNTKVHRRMPLHNHVENKYLLLLPATSPTPTHSKASMYSTHPIAGDNSSTFKVDTINHLHQIHVRVLSPAPHRSHDTMPISVIVRKHCQYNKHVLRCQWWGGLTLCQDQPVPQSAPGRCALRP
jgi:hypothetical protein